MCLLDRSFDRGSDVYKDLNAIINMQRQLIDLFKNFESKLSALSSKLNAQGTSPELSEYIAAMVLLTNANVDESRRVSVPATCATGTAASKLTAQSSIEEYT